MEACTFRVATSADAEAVALLHANSWRRHYRGAYSDEFLDGDVIADRLQVWSGRLATLDPNTQTVLAEVDAKPVGFAHAVLDDDPSWGALLDNLHVDIACQRRGLGTHLLACSARFIVDARPRSAMYLWVLAQNTAAQAFYRALGGEPTDTAPVSPPGGVARRLNGNPTKIRYVWTNPAAIADTDPTASAPATQPPPSDLLATRSRSL